MYGFKSDLLPSKTIQILSKTLNRSCVNDRNQKTVIKNEAAVCRIDRRKPEQSTKSVHFVKQNVVNRHFGGESP
jgi:hypothetical protein